MPLSPTERVQKDTYERILSATTRLSTPQNQLELFDQVRNDAKEFYWKNYQKLKWKERELNRLSVGN